ncbi:MAG TPA: aminotransferase [Beijerinckiaceae bacterium]
MPALVNPFVAATGSPPIPEAQAWARRYDGAHGPLLDLSQAVPGKPPHPAMLEALSAAAGSPDAARYGPILGDAVLREAYAAEMSATYGASLSANEVAITAGCNLAFVATAMLIAQAGDAVLLPTPWYFNHQMSLAMLGIEPRPLPCHAEAGFVPDSREAERLIDERTRAIVLVTPNNPTGAIYPEEVLEGFAALCRRRDLWLIVDETYRDFLPAGLNRPHGLFTAPDWGDNLVQLYSFSKSHGIPGHRLGAMTAGRDVIGEVAKTLDCLQICAARTAQRPVAEGITGLRAWREANRDEITRRASAFRAAFADLPGWTVGSVGAYFAYVRHPFAGRTAAQVAERLAAERGVLGLPGSYFGPGQEDHLRLAFANVAAERLAEIPTRLASFTV